jgi:hypothetical protein
MGSLYAYRWFPQDTVPTGAGVWTRAKTFCSTQCSVGCQLAIIRNISATAFLLSLQADGLAPNGYAVSFIGLQKNSTGSWIWIDGKYCNCSSLSIDQRCSGNCYFDNTGPYGNLNKNFVEIDDIDDQNSDGSMFCEVKCKISIMYYNKVFI